MGVLHTAMEAAEKWHCNQVGKTTIGSNGKTIVENAAAWMLDRLPGAVALKPAKEKSTDGKSPKKASGRMRKVDGEVDKFGFRLDSNFAKANAVLTTKPKKMSEIVSESGIPDTCYNHMNKLVAAGKIGKTSGKAYYLLEDTQVEKPT